MPDRSAERWAVQLPSTASIRDPDVRTFLDTLKNAWELRSGDTGATEDARFVTVGEMEEQTSRALGRVFSREVGLGGGGNGGGNNGGGGRSNRQMLDGLANWVVNSLLYRLLNERIQNLEAPYETIDKVNRQVSWMRSEIASITSLLGFGGVFPPGIRTISQWVSNTAAYGVTLNTTVSGHTSQILSLQTTTGTSATSIQALQTLTGQHTSQITTLLQTTATNATSISNMQVTQSSQGTRLNNAEGSISQINTINITSGSVAAQSIYMMRATLSSGSGPIGRIYWEDNMPTGGTYTVGDRWVDTNSNPLYQMQYWNGTAWQSGVVNFKDFVDAGFLAEQLTRADKDRAVARAVNTLWAILQDGSTGYNTASIIEDGALADSGLVTATAATWNSLQASVLGPGGTNLVAQIRTDLNAYVNADNGRAQSTYTLRVNAGGNIAGFGLIAEYDQNVDGAGGQMGSLPPRTAFGVVASSFWIAADSDAAILETGVVNPDTVPFIALTSPATINGDYYPAGTYIRKAFIVDGSIDRAKINQHIESDTFNGTFNGSGNINSFGTAGWAIDKSGQAVFHNVKVRGTSTVNRLVVEEAVEDSVNVPNNTVVTVNHNEGRKVMVTAWSPNGYAISFHTFTDNSFSLSVGGNGSTVFYRYW